MRRDWLRPSREQSRNKLVLTLGVARNKSRREERFDRKTEGEDPGGGRVVDRGWLTSLDGSNQFENPAQGCAHHEDHPLGRREGFASCGSSFCFPERGMHTMHFLLDLVPLAIADVNSAVS
jgi:hypothetical protein